MFPVLSSHTKGQWCRTFMLPECSMTLTWPYCNVVLRVVWLRSILQKHYHHHQVNHVIVNHQWTSPDKYGQINHINTKTNIITTKPKQNIYSGIQVMLVVRLIYITFSKKHYFKCHRGCHYGDVIMSTMASQITSITIVYSTVYSCTDQRKHQSSASLAFVRGIHRWPVNSPHKRPVTRKMFPFDDVIMDGSETKEATRALLFSWNESLYNLP